MACTQDGYLITSTASAAVCKVFVSETAFFTASAGHRGMFAKGQLATALGTRAPITTSAPSVQVTTLKI